MKKTTPIKVTEAKTSGNNQSKDLGKLIKKSFIKAVDMLLKIVSVVFILATSFRFISEWLAGNQLSDSQSIAGAIMILAVALYLIIRR